MALRLLEAAGGNGELFFAVGNAVFCWLLLRGRLIPSALAGLGLAWSIFLTALLLLQAGGMSGGRTDWSSPITWVVWLPMLVFELAFATWLLVKGVATRPRRAA
jgi:ABC-type glycerol-3-phosphate transport system permease component